MSKYSSKVAREIARRQVVKAAKLKAKAVKRFPDLSEAIARLHPFTAAKYLPEALKAAFRMGAEQIRRLDAHQQQRSERSLEIARAAKPSKWAGARVANDFSPQDMKKKLKALKTRMKKSGWTKEGVQKLMEQRRASRKRDQQVWRLETEEGQPLAVVRRDGRRTRHQEPERQLRLNAMLSSFEMLAASVRGYVGSGQTAEALNRLGEAVQMGRVLFQEMSA